MIEFRRLLVPYDFSESASHAARYACDLADRFGAEVTLLHVLPPLHYDFAMTEPTGERAKQLNEQRMVNARKSLTSGLADLTPKGGIRHEVIEGEPATEIIAAANSGNYDAVVMSTLGAGAFRRWFIIGSVTAKVLHASEHPVITSAHFEHHHSPSSIERILCAVDLGPQSSRVLCWAWQAAQRFDAKLSVAHAAPGIDEALIEQSSKETAGNRLMERVDELKRSLHVEADTLIEFSDPARAISHLAREQQADLVVLGRGVSQGLIGRLRANAYDIIRQCSCPVVSV